MCEKLYRAVYAGIEVFCRFRHPEAAGYFGRHLIPIGQSRSEVPDQKILTVSEELLRERDKIFYPGTKEAFKEFRVFVEPTGRYLSTRRRFIMHAVAFRWRERAWLFTAPSGTGKTTQYLNWKRLYPDEVEIICGDMPLLEWREDGQIVVHPSPWSGSEHYGADSTCSAPLGGIVYLSQDKQDRMEKADLHRLVKPIWHKIIGQADTEEQIRAREAFLDHMLGSYPVWMLANRGDTASARLARNVFEAYLEGEVL